MTLREATQDRFVLGLGVSHPHLAEKLLRHEVERVTVTIVEEGEAVATELELFPREDDAPDMAAVDTAVARLR